MLHCKRLAGVRLDAGLGLLGLTTILAISCVASNPSGAASSGNASPSHAAAGASPSPKTNPATMVKTRAGFEYWLAVGPEGPQASFDLYVVGSGTLPIAPPGQEYIYVPIQVTNRTDRPEPIFNVYIEDCCNVPAYVQLMVPFREFAQFGETSSHAYFCSPPLTDPVVGGVPSDPSSDCVLPSQGGGGLALAQCSGANLDANSCSPPAINVEAGQTTTIWVYFGPVPASAPAADIHVYFGAGLARIK